MMRWEVTNSCSKPQPPLHLPTWNQAQNSRRFLAVPVEPALLERAESLPDLPDPLAFAFAFAFALPFALALPCPLSGLRLLP